MKVMLIDDDPLVGEDLDLLFPAGIELVRVLKSETALTLLAQEPPPDVIILDLCMPPFLAEHEEKEGLELLSVIRGWLGPKVPVVVLSSLPQGELKDVCLKHGARGYLEKPCDVKRLLDKLSSISGSDSQSC